VRLDVRPHIFASFSSLLFFVGFSLLFDFQSKSLSRWFHGSVPESDFTGLYSEYSDLVEK
jgi:hypothetical protein